MFTRFKVSTDFSNNVESITCTVSFNISGISNGVDKDIFYQIKKQENTYFNLPVNVTGTDTTQEDAKQI